MMFIHNELGRNKGGQVKPVMKEGSSEGETEILSLAPSEATFDVWVDRDRTKEDETERFAFPELR